MNKKEILRNLQTIPGIGKAGAADLFKLGIKSPKDLKNKDPEKLYRKLEHIEGKHVDRCVLYVLRCAVYYINNKKHKKDLLKWWNWKDK